MSNILRIDSENDEIYLFEQRLGIERNVTKTAESLLGLNTQINDKLIPSPIGRFASLFFDSFADMIKNTADNVRTVFSDIVYGAM